ncbi:transcriptional regulator [Pseudomonas fluorescens]|uniref:OmpR/PhoB-type domain-containing protein n=1 Tax=Pseudomonas fluorescens TaxID=294 RepID=A0A5E7Q751_PSEFL|nr:winged helix-turn-helix domain-containing protein [Pseudomonas fluorescens]VVP54793.1 hypothetical protein PS880_05607 [Pseudomonas fluorescens]
MGQVLIDRQLVFDENNFLLFRSDATDIEPFRLGAIASRCLAMLLRSGGAVVRKRELMDGAWGEYGLDVTDNSLAQVIRQLRLALGQLCPDREFIQTLPRIGYKLIEGVSVEELSVAPRSMGLPQEDVTIHEIPSALAPATAPTTIGEEPRAPVFDTAPLLRKMSSKLPLVSSTLSWRRWGMWLSLPLWGCGAFFLAQAWWAPVEIVGLEYAAPVVIGDVHVHPPLSGMDALPQSQRDVIIQRNRTLATWIGLSRENMHLYLIPARQMVDQILCDGELEKATSRCVGVQHD